MLATTTGFPVLHPEPEPVDGLALATKAIEAVGLVTALSLLRHRPAVSHSLIPAERNPDMNGTKSSRPIPLALTMLVAFFAALTALAVSNGHDAHAHGNAGRHAERGVASQAALRSDMRVLWEDHITWTRLAIISLTTGSPDTTATVGRLLKNQTDIGNAVKPFYGKAAGNALTAELREAHPDRRRRDRRGQGRRPGEARRRSGALAEQRERHRRPPGEASIPATGRWRG